MLKKILNNKEHFKIIIAIVFLFVLVTSAKTYASTSDYTVTVPEQLTVGENATVSISGGYGMDIEVKTPSQVDLSATAGIIKTTANISFGSLVKAPSSTSVSKSLNASFASTPKLGNWSGSLTYTVTASPHITTVLFTDGHLIINEDMRNRDTDVTAHGDVVKDYDVQM